MAEKTTEFESEAGTVKITRASYALQDKAGSGEIDPQLIVRADTYMNENNEDFTPLALEHLARLARILSRIKTNKLRSGEIIQELVVPIMHLKANGRMFRYDLVTDLAATMLTFLESLDQLDSDIIALVETHLASQQLLIAKQIKGNGGSNGQLLKQELEDALRRYNKKNPVGFKDSLN